MIRLGILTLLVICLAPSQQTATTRSILSLPDLGVLTGNDQGTTKYKFSGCEIAVSQDNCNISFEPDPKTCKSGVSLNGIIKKFIPALDLSKLTNNMVVPNIFKIKKFLLNKCDGEISFTAEANEPFDLVGGKLKISQGQLSLAFSYKASEFKLSNIGVKIKGTLTAGGQTLKIAVEKKKKSDVFMFSAEGKKLGIADFKNMFTKKDAEDGKVPENMKSLTKAVVDEPKITGSRAADGSYEFVLSGKLSGTDVMDSATVFILIQKKEDSGVNVAFICQLKKVSPSQILSSIFKKDLTKLPLLGDVTVDFVLEIASETIDTVYNKDLNKALLPFVSKGRSICKGAKFKIEIPIREIVKNTNKHMVGNVPEKIQTTIFISEDGINFIFPEDFKTNLLNILIAITPALPKLLPKSVFKNGPPKVDFKRFDVDVKSGKVDISAIAPDPIVIGNDIVTISNVIFELKHEKKPDSPWEFNIQADQKIGNSTLTVAVTKKGKSNFVFSGKIRSLTTKALMQKFGAKLFPTKALEDMDFFDFGLKNLEVTGAIAGDFALRISANPVLFGWDGAAIEGFIFGEKEKNMALGIALQKIRLDEIVMKLFKKRLSCKWLSEINVGIVVSNVDAGKDKKIAFTNDDLKKLPIKKGATMTATMTLPSDCKGDKLCMEAKSVLDKDTKFLLEGKITSSGMLLRASYKGNMNIKGSLELTDVNFVVTVGKETEVYFEVTLKLKEPKVTFKGKLRIGATGQVELKLTMDGIWQKPFGLNYLAFGNMILAVGMQPGVPVPMLEIGAEVHFGRINSGKEIKAKAYLGINPNKPTKSYFYTNINKFSAGKIAEAFDYNLKMPKVLADSGFPEGVVASFTLNPSGKTIEHVGIKIESGFSLKGLINILGFKLRCHIVVNLKKEIMLDVAFSPIKIGNGLLAIQRSRKDEENGPKLFAKIATDKVDVKIQGYLNMLGLSAEVTIEVNDDYMRFEVYGNLFNLFAANVTVQAGYKKLEEASFLISACISTPIGNIQDQVGDDLDKVSDSADTAVKEAGKRVMSATKLFDVAKEKLVGWETKVKDYEAEIEESCEKVQKIKEELEDPCLEKCGEVCVGGAYWKKKCTKVLGKWLPCSKWNKCKHMAPDGVCIAKCKGSKIWKKTKGTAKQVGIEVMLGILKGLKVALKGAHSFVDKARVLAEYAEKGFNSVKKAVEVGTEIGKSLAKYSISKLVNIHNICFNTSLEKAATSCFGIDVNATLFGDKHVKFATDACLDVSFIQTIAKVVKEKLFPAVKFFKSGLEKAKSLFTDMDSKKEELENDIEKEEQKQEMEMEDETKRSEVVFDAREKMFEKIAFGDLPRVTLRDDETMRAFEEKSAWNLATRDLVLDYDTDEDESNLESGSGESGSADSEDELMARSKAAQSGKDSGCDLIKSALADLKPVVTALYSFHENVHLQRKSFMEDKKRKVIELRSAKEELESECQDNDLSDEDRNDALYFYKVAENGTQNWLRIVKSQIKDQERRGLLLFRKEIDTIMKFKHGVGMSTLLQNVDLKKGSETKRDHVFELKFREKLAKISKAAERLIFDHRLSFEKDKPVVMKILYKEMDDAVHMLQSCS